MTTQINLAQVLRDAIEAAENIAVCNKRECNSCHKDAKLIVKNLKVIAAHDSQREVGEVEPVAWRWKHHHGVSGWLYHNRFPAHVAQHEDGIIEPLYAAPASHLPGTH